MRDIIEDFKIILIILLGSVIYSFILYNKINLVKIVNILLIVVFSISICTIIVSYKYDKKYLNSLYKYLSISFFGIGIVSISYNYIVESGIYDELFWNSATNFNMAFSIFESLILLFCFKNKDKTVDFKRSFGGIIIYSFFTIYLGVHYEQIIDGIFGHSFYEKIQNYPIIIATILKFYLLYFVYSIRKQISKRLYINFLIFLCSRLLLHILGLLNFDYNTTVTVVVSCLVLLMGNYSMAKIMLIDIIRVPQDSLYRDLSEKTKNLENTVLKMKEISDERDIISSNYDKKEKEEQLRNNILVNLSHEFKTPINVIYAAIQTQEMKNSKSDNEKSMKYNSVIKQNCNRLIRLIDNFIDVTSLENKSLKLNFQYINIVEVTENIVFEVRKFAQIKNINIIFDTEEEEIYAYLDKILYRRAILNILSNSIKYTNIESNINVSISVIDTNVCIKISDEGIGIEEDNLESVFNRFERIDKSFSRDAEGCGLGLNLVKEIIKLFNGKLRICSAKRVGTCIEITIPRSDISDYEKSKVINDSKDEDNIKHEVEIEMSDIYFN